MAKKAKGTPHDPIPVTILTGFLGSGKTTLLNHILHAEHGLKVAVLVNDFGAINIDTQLVVGLEGDGDTISLANGCICCTIRDDLARAVLDLLRRDDPPEYMIVETSGVSDPVAVANTFVVMEGVKIDSILTVIDAEQYKSLGRANMMLAMDQVRVADIIILNKVDLVTPQEREKIKHEWIYEINPRARVIEAEYGNVPLELVLGVGEFALERLAQRETKDIHVHEVGVTADHEHEHHDDEHEDHAHEHHDHSLVFSTWSYTTEKPFSYKALRRVIDQLPTTIFRAKGIFFLADAPDYKGVLHVVGSRVQLSLREHWNNQIPHSQVVVIGSHGDIDSDDLNVRFESALAENAPASELERLMNIVMNWLRAASA
jgi:G3E family GTPase